MGATNRPQELDEAVLRYVIKSYMHNNNNTVVILFFVYVSKLPTCSPVYLLDVLQRGFM